MGRIGVRAGWVLALAALPWIASACDSPTGAQSGATASIYLKDGPGDVDSVWVQVNDVVLVGEDGSGSMSLLSAPTDLINVTALRTTALALIEGADLAAGHYEEVRFVIGAAVLQVGERVYSFGGAEHPHGLPTTDVLQCPSCSQSGIKVKLSDGFEVGEGENGLLLDFDVSQSFGHEGGQSGTWVMHPVIHGTEAHPDEIEHDDAGAEIKGTISLGLDVAIPACGGAERSLASFVPTATAMTLTDGEGGPMMFSGHSEREDGSFEFEIEVSDFDTFTLGYQGETTFEGEKLVWTAEVAPETVALSSENDEVDGVAYTITDVSCEAIVTP